MGLCVKFEFTYFLLEKRKGKQKKTTNGSVCLYCGAGVTERLPPRGSWRGATEGVSDTKIYLLGSLNTIKPTARVLLHPLRGSPLAEGAFQLLRRNGKL